jgi:glucosamine--fructose-6-phosphate aminotransferase (isomerizing)
MMGGTQFEAEIREQPAVLARLAVSRTAKKLEAAIGDREPIFIGSGSSLFVAELAALAWRRLGRRAEALAASEARFQAGAHRGCCVVSLSQSGRTADVLDALDALGPARTIALTNAATSPLAARADITIDIGAGPETAVPASKSVTAMAAIVLWAAARTIDGDGPAASALERAASDLGTWLDADATAEMDRAAMLLEPAHSIIVVGAGYGVPVASEIALKIKEASYRHAEGFGAGEFRHGSTAILEPLRGMLGLRDAASRTSVGGVLEVARNAGSIVAALGDAVADVPVFGPPAAGRFAPLAWIVGGQLLALALARRAGIDSDAPRGLQKYLG